MSYLEELLPEFKKGAKIRRKDWRDGKYIKLSGVYAKDEYGDVYFIEPNEITADDWELYKDPEPDWQYIIDHKCLCWFWDDEEENRQIGYLCFVDDHGGFVLEAPDDCYNSYINCRPVRRDEVTFYEDKK
nr:MAG TPA: Protein of unknown function (DUF2829) [Bacteriophage sp.]